MFTSNGSVKIGLAVGITIIFLGIAINPAIAINPFSSDNEEDCNICHPVSKQHLVRLKKFLNRFETLDNKMLVMSKNNPKITETYQELSDKITTLREMNKKLKPFKPYEDNPIICKILWKSITFFISIFNPLENLFDELLENRNLILYCIVVILTIPINIFYIIIAVLFVDVFDCMYKLID